MQSTPQPIPMPTASPALMRRLPWAVVGSLVLAAVVTASVIGFTGRDDWWPAFAAASVVATLGAGVSVLILSRAANKTVDLLITIMMGVSAARMFISLIGLLVAVKGLQTPPESTGMMICGYYFSTLLVETVLMKRVAQRATQAD